MTGNASRLFVAEFVGTALLLAVVVGSGIMGVRLSGGNDGLALLANSVATGAALAVLIQVFSPISGAHFNPAVSLVFALRGQLPGRSLAIMLFAQVSGAIAGVLLAHGMFDLQIVQAGVKERTGGGQWLSEFVATFGLLLVILGFSRWRIAWTPAAVGLFIMSAYWFTASTSFANPAVSLARAFTTTFAGIRLADVLPFALAQLAGALAASQLEAWLHGPETGPSQK